MSNVTDRIQEECNKFFKQNYSLTVPQDWLSQCIEFVLETYPNESITNYRQLIYKQLLDFDLNQICSSCLPEKLYTAKNGTINGSFLLQVDFCFDSNKSCYSQLQELTGSINENALIDADIVPSNTQFEKKDSRKNRLFTFNLSDGTRTVKAIEYNLIYSLNEIPLPGTKIQLSGQISFINQTLHLTNGNLKVLGGEVPEIGTKEYLIQLLHNMIQEKLNSSNIDREKCKKFESTPIISSKDIPNNKHKSQTYPKKEQFSQKYLPPYKQENKENVDIDDDDDILVNCDFSSIESSNKTKSNLQIKSACKRQPSFENSIPLVTTFSNPIAKADIRNSSNNKKIKTENSQPNQTSFTLKEEIKTQVKMSKNIVRNESDDDILRDLNLECLESNGNCKKMQSIKPNMSESNAKQENPPTKDTTNNLIIMNRLKTVKTEPNNQIEYNDILNYERCCLGTNKPSILLTDQTNFSTCIHKTVGFVKVFTGHLKQSKLKWSHDCILSDMKFKEHPAYLDNDPIEYLLDLTCVQAKEIFKKSKESNKPENEYSLLFEKKKSEYFQRLSNIKFTMHLKYNLDQKKFCIFKIENIELKDS